MNRLSLSSYPGTPLSNYCMFSSRINPEVAVEIFQLIHWFNSIQCDTEISYSHFVFVDPESAIDSVKWCVANLSQTPGSRWYFWDDLWQLGISDPDDIAWFKLSQVCEL